MATPSTAVLLQKLDGLEALVTRVEKKLDSFDCRIQDVEKENAKTATVIIKVDDHENRLRALEKLAPAMRAVIWVASVLGVSLIALIWALITGQALIVFK